MSPNRFEHLLTLVGPQITRKTTQLREPISAPQRLTLTLCYLATGESQQSLSFSYRVEKSTVSQIVSETSLAIYEVLKDPFMKKPSTAEDWMNISDGFEESWNFPHCIGAIDGEHIRIECPKLTGTYYYNYKGFYSIILLAICDSNYCFTLFDLGHYGSNNDSEILAKFKMGEIIAARKLGIPDPSQYSTSDPNPLPYFLLIMRFSH